MRTVALWRRLAPVLGIVLVLLAWSAGTAGAQDAEPSERVVLRAVDATDSDEVELVFSYTGDAGDVGDLELTVAGDAVDADVVPLAETNRGLAIVFVVDTSRTTDANALLTNVREGLGPIVASLPAGTQAGVVSVGGAAQQVQRITSNPVRLGDAVDSLTPSGDGALHAGLVRAAGMLDRAAAVPTVVLVTDGVINPVTTMAAARADLREVGAVLHIVGLQNGRFDETGFSGLARSTGGTTVVTTDPEQIPTILDDVVGEATRLFSARFEGASDNGIQDLTLRVGEASVFGSYIAGSELVGANRLVVRPPVEPDGISFFHGDQGKAIGLIAGLLAAVMFTYAIVLLFVRENTGLSAVLRPYSEGFGVQEADDDGDGGAQSQVQTAFLQRAVRFTENLAERQGMLARVESKLEKADMPLRAGEALFFYGVGAALLTVLVLALSQNLLATLILGGLAVMIPPAVVNFLANRKKKRFEALLPDTLQLLASTLRAGYSMMQGVEAVSQEAAEPMGQELRRVVTEARLGRPLEESLEAIGDRMGSNDFKWAVMAIRIQREVGGNLSELLMTVAETMTQRERLRRDINSLTAEGRMSAYVLGVLPPGLGFAMYTINPGYIEVLFTKTPGQIMLGLGFLLAVAGFLWMNKIIKIEI